MAKMICEFDTVSKSMSVTQDGKKIENVSYFSCGMMEKDKSYCDIYTMEKNEDMDMMTTTHMMASEDGSFVKRLEEHTAKTLAKMIVETK